jgi:hypothetical protein
LERTTARKQYQRDYQTDQISSYLITQVPQKNERCQVWVYYKDILGYHW